MLWGGVKNLYQSLYGCVACTIVELRSLLLTPLEYGAERRNFLRQILEVLSRFAEYPTARSGMVCHCAGRKKFKLFRQSSLS